MLIGSRNVAGSALSALAGGGFLGNLFVKLTADSSALIRGMNDAERSVTGGVAEMSRQFKMLSAVAVGAYSAVGGFAVKLASDFENSFAGVRKTVQATEDEFRSLASQFREMARSMPVDVNQINEIAKMAGQLGIKKENIADFTKNIIQLGVASQNLAGADAAESLARFGNIMGIAEEETANVASAITFLGRSSATSENEIATLARRVASAGRLVGLSASEVLGLSTAISSVGLSAELGGTAISRTLIGMAKAAKSGGTELALFSSIAGMTAQQFQKSFGEDAIGTLGVFFANLKTLADQGEDVFTILDQLSIEGIRQVDVINRLALANRLLNKYVTEGAQAYKDGNEHVRMANERFKTFTNQTTISWNIVKDFAQTIGEALVPALKILNQMFRDGAEDQKLFGMSALEIADTFAGPLTFAIGAVGDSINGWKMILKEVQIFFLNVAITIWGEINRITEGSIDRVNALIRAMNKIRPILAPATLLLPGGGKIPEVKMTPSEIMAGLNLQREELEGESLLLANQKPFSERFRTEYQKTINEIRNGNRDIKQQIEGTYTSAELGILAASGAAKDLSDQVKNTQQLLRDFESIPFMSLRGRHGGNMIPGAGLQGFPVLQGTDPLTTEAFENSREMQEAKNSLKILEEIDKQKIQLDAETLRRKQEMHEAYLAKLKKLNEAERQIIINSAMSIGDSLVDIAKNLAGEQSGIYKAMFAASKAFAIADATVKIAQGIANAAAQPWPVNLAAIAQVIAATASIISNIRSVTLAFDGERATGGMVQAGKAYLVGERGPEPFVPASNGTIIPNNRMGGDVKVVVHNYTDAQAQVRERQEGDSRVIEVTVRRIKDELASEIRDGRGSISRAIEGSYGVRRGRV